MSVHRDLTVRDGVEALIEGLLRGEPASPVLAGLRQANNILDLRIAASEAGRFDSVS